MSAIHLALAIVITAAPNAEQRAVEALKAAGIERYQDPAEMVRRAHEASLDEATILRWLSDLYAPCLAQAERCGDFGLATEPSGTLLTLLGEVGDDASIPLLWRLSARGVFEAEQGMDRLLARRMLRAGKNCQPPTPKQIAAQRAKLDGFFVLRTRSGALVAEAPTARELDDLAYFLASMRKEGPQVGAGHDGPAHLPSHHDDGAREAIMDRLNQAELRGDVKAVASEARAYLETLGYPAIREHEETSWSWGGGRHSQVMRILARADEVLGNFAEAAELYRQADPGGGACGTSVAYRWSLQVQGLIRAEEGARGCEAIVAERLLAIDERRGDRSEYGPERLATAGFDVERLYRGALVTVGRRGPEDWEYRVRAVEGLADVGGKNAIPVLVELLDSAAPGIAARAVKALGDLGDRRCFPCGGIGFHGICGGWERHVESLDNDCDHPMPDEERASLARMLVPVAMHGEMGLRQEAIRALGNIGSPAVIPELEQLAQDETKNPDECRPQGEGEDYRCEPVYAFQEDAAEALHRIREIEAQAASCVEP